MTDIQAAVAIAWERLIASPRMQDVELDDADKLIFQIAFSMGTDHGLTLAKGLVDSSLAASGDKPNAGSRA